MKKYYFRTIIVASGLLLAIGCLAQYFRTKHYIEEYEPIYIAPKHIADYEDEYFIEGLTYVSYENAYCNTAALEMIGLKHGIDRALHYYNWLTGFSYGAAAFLPDYLAMYGPYTDPESGNKFAAPFLGLKRNYFVTNSKDLYTEAIKSYLSRDYPLRIALDAGTYANLGRFVGHSILLVGYNDSEVIYYETGLSDRRIQDHPGESMSWEIFMDSVKSMSSVFGYPWTYNFTVFTEAYAETDIINVWQRNADNMIGFDYKSVVYGSKAIFALAEALEDRALTDSEKESLKGDLEQSTFTREDNSNFIQSNFDESLLLEAADLLKEASEIYSSIDIEDNERLVSSLKECAQIEEQAGILIDTYCAKE
jgi:hypothetical protein